LVGNDPILHQKLISFYYDIAMGRHPSVLVTSKSVKKLFYWKEQYKHIKQVMRKCPVYQKNKGENVLPSRPLKPLPIHRHSFIDTSMDFI